MNIWHCRQVQVWLPVFLPWQYKRRWGRGSKMHIHAVYTGVCFMFISSWKFWLFGAGWSDRITSVPIRSLKCGCRGFWCREEVFVPLLWVFRTANQCCMDWKVWWSMEIAACNRAFIYVCQVTFTNHLQLCRIYIWLFDDDTPLNAPIFTHTQQCISTGWTMVKKLLLRPSAIVTPEHVSFNSFLDDRRVVHPSLLQQWYHFSYTHCNTSAKAATCDDIGRYTLQKLKHMI